MSATEQVERDLTLSFRTFSTIKKALLYADDTTDDEATRYKEAVKELVDEWNEATQAERERGDDDA